MRFDSIHVSRYGCLTDLRTPAPLPSIVVVLGPNESGKSTFFSFLTNLLYGFQPATRENHPYTPWSGGGDPEGRARIRLDDGSVLDIHRRLTSSGRGSLTIDGRRDDIRNRALPALDHVNRGVFRHVYALTLAELAVLEGESWNIVQDRLVAALGMRGLRPAREVANEFEAEANRLWRPDRRGRPRFRVLQDELAGLDERRRKALERDRTLRARVAERVAAKARLGSLRDRRRSERERREVLEHRLGRLLHVRRGLVRLDEHRRAAGSPEELDGLPRDPRGHLDALRGRRRAAGVRVEELAREAAICRETVRAYGDGFESAIVADEEGVRRAVRLKVGMPELEREVAAADDELAEMTERCKRLSGWLFSVPLTDVSQEAIRRVPNSELRGCVRDYEGARAKLDVEEEADGGRSLMRLPGAMRPGPARLVAGVALLAAGLALSAWPILVPDATLALGDILVTATVALSAALLTGVTGTILLIVRRDAVRRYRQYKRAVAAAERQRTDRIADLRAGAEAAKGAVAALVAELPVASGLLEAPNLDLPAGIDRIADLLERLRERKRVLVERREKLEGARREIRRVQGWVEAQVDDESLAELGGLTGVLEQALKAREGAAVAQQHLDRIEGERAQAEGEREAAAWEEDSFETRLAVFADDDPERGAQAASERLDAWRRAEELGRELEREHPDLAEMADEIAAAEQDGETWDDLPDRIEAANARHDSLTERSEEVQAEIGRLDTEIARLREGETVDAVEGRIAVVKARMREAREGRDRAFVLARLVREADHRFREANQPELLLRAGRYLRHVTRDRYDRIEMGEAGDESFYLREPSGTGLIPVGETTSQGTREQVYLALRLAIVNHLDSGRERLPIFMDETLVNWDAWRRDRAFDLLEQLSAERQVFIFTCHPAMAAEMEDRGGTVVALGGG